MLYAPAVHAYECNEEIDKLSKEYEIKIICKKESILDKNMDFTFIEAEQEKIDNATKSIKQFLLSFDKSFLKEKLETINLFKDLLFIKSKVGGLNHKQHVWVSLENFSKAFADKKYLEVLHHEFSSNIYKTVAFDVRTSWVNLNNIYNYSISFLRKCLNDINFCSLSTSELLQNGFLCNYAITNDENDFNLYAEELFVSPERMKFLSNQYPLIKIKLHKFKEIYKKTGFKGKFPDEP